MALAEPFNAARESESSSASTVGANTHGTSMAVWDVPTPSVSGATFRPRIGVRCGDGCSLSGARIEVLDDSGKRVATGTLGPLPWPETTDLYWAEVEIRAPEDEAYHGWSARFPQASNGTLRHAGSDQPFGLRTVRPPQCTVKVSVTDANTREPIETAYVRLGLYTAYTDRSGLAKVSVPKDKYEFVVWKTLHKIQRTTLEVADDQDLRVELSGCKVCHGFN